MAIQSTTACQVRAGAPDLSRDRVEFGSVNIPVGVFPQSASAIPLDPQKIARTVVNKFNEALSRRDYPEVGKTFLANGYWRDHLALTWDLHTIKGRDDIIKFLADGHRLLKIEIDSSDSFRSPHNAPIDGFGDVQGIESFVTLETAVGRGSGVVRLAEEDGSWKIFTLFSALLELTGFEEPIKHRRTKGVEHGGMAGRKNWLERTNSTANLENSEPVVLIVGKTINFCALGSDDRIDQQSKVPVKAD